jgi:hypothetical protein
MSVWLGIREIVISAKVCFFIALDFLCLLGWEGYVGHNRSLTGVWSWMSGGFSFLQDSYSYLRIQFYCIYTLLFFIHPLQISENLRYYLRQ